MANRFWEHNNDFVQGNKIQPSPTNAKLDGVEAGFEAVEGELDLMVKMPASWAGNHQVPTMTVTNTFLYFDANGDATLYAKADFDADVAAAAASAAAAATSASNASISAGAASSSASTASGQAGAASASAAAAVVSASLAEDWATEAEDTEVTPGEYSAYHWAQKAIQAMPNGWVSAYINTNGAGAPTVDGEGGTMTVTVARISVGLYEITLSSAIANYATMAHPHVTPESNIVYDDISVQANMQSSTTCRVKLADASTGTRIDADFFIEIKDVN